MPGTFCAACRSRVAGGSPCPAAAAAASASYTTPPAMPSPASPPGSWSAARRGRDELQRARRPRGRAGSGDEHEADVSDPATDLAPARCPADGRPASRTPGAPPRAGGGRARKRPDRWPPEAPAGASVTECSIWPIPRESFDKRATEQRISRDGRNQRLSPDVTALLESERRYRRVCAHSQDAI